MSLNQTTTNPEFQDARSLYESGSPIYTGSFVMSRQLARAAPVNLDEVYEPAINVLQADSIKAQTFAKRYGKLSVLVALDDAPTSFGLDHYERPIPKTAPIKTTRPYLPSSFFAAADRDAPYTYLLCDDQAMTAELALIQALHMLDYAIVSDQFDGNLPVIRTTSLEQLLELQAKEPSTLIRTYGNARRLNNAPFVLGTVVPTDTLEKSNIETGALETPSQIANLRIVPELAERAPATAFGITTAKRPHIGHGFLLVKALAEAGEDGNVIIELNDRGPRVARAVSALAVQAETSVERIIDDIMYAEISPSALEAAYRARGDAEEVPLPSDFALTANNAFYTYLFEKLCPPGNSLTAIANSSSTMSALTDQLLANPNTQGLFGDSSMVLIGNETATVVRQYDEPTLPGIIGAFAAGFELTFVDSPSPLDRPAQQNFAEAGIPVNLKEGIGISFDFGVASGSGGEAPSLLSVMSLVERENPAQTLQLLRALLNGAAFVPGDGKSLNPNFANTSVLQAQLEELAGMDLSEVDIYKPFEFTNITRDVCRSLTPYIGEDPLPTKGKINPSELRTLLAYFPGLEQRLSDGAKLFAQAEQASASVPRKSLTQKDTNLISKLRTADPRTILNLVLSSIELDPDFARKTKRVTQLGGIMERMGYEAADMGPFVEKLLKAGGIYVLK